MGRALPVRPGEFKKKTTSLAKPVLALEAELKNTFPCSRSVRVDETFSSFVTCCFQVMSQAVFSCHWLCQQNKSS